MDKFEVSVIIPCYNEEGNLQECVRRIPQIGSSLEIIIVNDGSTDKTREVARRIIDEYQHIKLLDFSCNRGKAWAVKEGINLASGQIIMLHDADLSVAPEYLKIFYDRFIKEGGSFFTATRFYFKMDKKAMPLRNVISNRITAKVFSSVLGQKVTDTLCGTKAFSWELKKYLRFSGCRWPDFDLLLAAKNMGLEIKEIPVEYLPRRYGKSAMRLYPDAWQLLKRLIRITWEVRR